MQTETAKPKIKPNERQQQAIDIQNGQVMLLAGPGTGKTFTVINRIEQMIENGVDASTILCLTFSDAAANEMRQRLIKKIGVKASSVDVYTYHSFCNDVIKQYPEQFSLSLGVRLITETEKLALMKATIDEVNPQIFVPNRADKYFYAKSFVGYVEHLKSLRISKEEYLSNIDTNSTLMPMYNAIEAEIYEREQNGKTQNKGRYAKLETIKKNIGKAKELWDLKEVYAQKMVEKNLIDFADMICFVLNAFEEDENFKEEVSNKYRYFLVDEYQDTNELQNKIIFNLVDANNEKNIFVVGDDDQIIYGFQGAKSDNIENFLTKYPETKVICLEENNRSTQEILDFSYKLVSQDPLRLENNETFKKYNISKKLVAKNAKIIAKERKIRRIEFGDSLQEFNYIVEDIEKLVNSEDCPKNEDGTKNLSQIAILCRKNDVLHSYSEMLKGKNIPCQLNEGKSIFNIRSTILIYYYMCVLCNHTNATEKLYSLLLAEPFKINLEDYNELMKQHNITKLDFVNLMRQLKNWKEPQKIEKFLNTYKELQEFAQADDLRNTVIEIINRTGILTAFYANQKNRTENLMGIKKIIDEATQLSKIEPTTSLQDFVDYLKQSLYNEIPICIDKSSIVQNAVQLTTYHGSKGREFEYVYLPRLTAKVWEKQTDNGYKYITDEVLEDEDASMKKDSDLLKLLFVGITRAKYALTLSFADAEEEKPQQITKYLAEFADYPFESEQIPYNAEDFTHEFFRAISRDVFDNQKAFEAEIRERVKQIVLSPSRLNDYLACPRKFFYLKVLGIDVEESNWDSANFGTIIHGLLENAVRRAKKTGVYPTSDEIREELTKGLEESAFSSDAIKEKFVKLGNNVIEKYYPKFSEIPVSRVDEVEFSLRDIDVDGDFITGKIDRIEKNSDGTYQLYDYKTGSAVSENQIAIGGTKENYFNQLCFYKYAFEKLTDKKVAQTGIIYVEENVTREKTLTTEDMAYIENKIKEVYENIKNLKFNPSCDPSSCKFCQYQQMCKLDLI